MATETGYTNFKQIENDLRNRIVNGEWLAGEKILSCREYASQYKCSVNTIEKALKVLDETNFIIRQQRKRSIVNYNVQVKKAKGLVAVFVMGIDNPLWTSALRGIEDYLHGYGVSMISGSHDLNPDKLKQTLANLANLAIDGIIISPISHNEKVRMDFYNLIQLLLMRNVKVVLLDRFIHNLKIPYVSTDNVKASYKLTNMLIDSGHHKIGFVRVSRVSTIEERLLGFKQACFEQGITNDEICDFFISTEQEDYRDENDVFCKLLGEKIINSEVTALFASNDQVAKSILMTLDNLGLRMPEDISLVTYDVDNLNQLVPYKLTGVRQNFYGMGKLSAEILLNQIYTNSQSNDSKLSHIASSEIVTGESIKNIMF